MLVLKLSYFQSTVSGSVAYLNPAHTPFVCIKTAFNTVWSGVYRLKHSPLTLIEIFDGYECFLAEWFSRTRCDCCVVNFNDLRLLFLLRKLKKHSKRVILFLNYQGSAKEIQCVKKILLKNQIYFMSEDFNFLPQNFSIARLFQSKQLRLI